MRTGLVCEESYNETARRKIEEKDTVWYQDLELRPRSWSLETNSGYRTLSWDLGARTWKPELIVSSASPGMAAKKGLRRVVAI